MKSSTVLDLIKASFWPTFTVKQHILSTVPYCYLVTAFILYAFQYFVSVTYSAWLAPVGIQLLTLTTLHPFFPFLQCFCLFAFSLFHPVISSYVVSVIKNAASFHLLHFYYIHSFTCFISNLVSLQRYTESNSITLFLCLVPLPKQRQCVDTTSYRCI